MICRVWMQSRLYFCNKLYPDCGGIGTRVALCSGRSSKSGARNASTDELSSDANIHQAYGRIEKNDLSKRHPAYGD